MHMNRAQSTKQDESAPDTKLKTMVGVGVLWSGDVTD